jgi:hypothetical protein
MTLLFLIISRLDAQRPYLLLVHRWWSNIIDMAKTPSKGFSLYDFEAIVNKIHGKEFITTTLLLDVDAAVNFTNEFKLTVLHLQF